MRRHYNIADRRLVETKDEKPLLTVFVNPDESERRHLLEALKVDEHTLNSALDPDELSRLEFEPEHAAIIFKMPRNYSAAERFLFKVLSAGAFLFKDQLVIVLFEDVPLFDGIPFARVSTPAGLVLRMISRSIIHFREHLKVINMISDALQDEINRAMENKHLINMFTLQKSLVYYVNSLNFNGALLERIRNNAAKFGFSAEEAEFLDDIIIENNQCYRQAEMYSNILASLMDARASIVNNNLNVLMKTLNIIVIALMMPTLIVSIFSMNVSLPLRHENSLSFWFILGLAGLSVALFTLLWRYTKR